MVNLNQIVNVTVTKDTKTVSRVGFGIPLIIGANAAFPERIRSYTDIASVAVDFAVTTAEYKAANAIFSQNPSPATIKIGRVGTAAIKQKINLVPGTPLEGDIFSVIINGTTFSYTALATPTIADVVTGLFDAITAGSEPVTPTDNTTDLDIEADVSGTDFTFAVSDNLTVKSTSVYGESITDALTAIRNVDDNFYLTIMTSRTESEILLLAAAIESLPKMCIIYSSDSDVKNKISGNVAEDIKALGYEKTYIFYGEQSLSFPDAALAGRVSPFNPGSITWIYKNLIGVAADLFNPTELSNLSDQLANIYTEIGGLSVTYKDGKVASGEFADVIRGIDWTISEIQAEVLSLLANNEKIPYTNKGITAIGAAILKVLNQGVANGLYSEDVRPIIILPDSSTISTADKTSRTLNNVEFEATLAGAIHKVLIRGRVTV
jgi:hypothetical protein